MALKNTLVDILIKSSEKNPDKIAFNILDDKGEIVGQHDVCQLI